MCYGISWALNNLALLYYEQGNMDGAMELLERAIQLDPYSPNAYINLAGGLHWLGVRDSAHAVINLLEENFPGQPWVHRVRSNMLAAEWDYEAAQVEVDQLMRSGSTSGRRWALENQSAIDLAEGKVTLAQRRWQDSR